LSGATTQNKQVFNILCEQPETVSRGSHIQLVSSYRLKHHFLTSASLTWMLRHLQVAAYLVPRMRTVVARNGEPSCLIPQLHS
jgi:hypothetical protein